MKIKNGFIPHQELQESKKATEWLNKHSVAFIFHDYKKQEINTNKLREWSRQLDTEQLINRKGTSLRKLNEEQKEKDKNEAQVNELIASNTSMIKRHIIEKDGKILTVGFDEEEFNSKYSSKKELLFI